MTQTSRKDANLCEELMQAKASSNIATNVSNFQLSPRKGLPFSFWVNHESIFLSFKTFSQTKDAYDRPSYPHALAAYHLTT
jgi:hypothetical protein